MPSLLFLTSSPGHSGQCVLSSWTGPLNTKPSQADTVQLASERCSCCPQVCGFLDGSCLLADLRAVLLVSGFHDSLFLSCMKMFCCSGGRPAVQVASLF